MHRQSREEFYGSETTLCDTIMVEKCHYLFVQICRMYHSKSEPLCKLWTLGDNVTLINCNKYCKYIPLMILIMGNCACGEGGRECMEISLLSPQFCCDPKIAVK
jgi:hypothetical protein